MFTPLLESVSNPTLFTVLHSEVSEPHALLATTAYTPFTDAVNVAPVAPAIGVKSEQLIHWKFLRAQELTLNLGMRMQLMNQDHIVLFGSPSLEYKPLKFYEMEPANVQFVFHPTKLVMTLFGRLIHFANIVFIRPAWKSGS